MTASVVTKVHHLDHKGLTIADIPGKPKPDRSIRFVHGLGSGVKYVVYSACLLNLAHGIVERVLNVRGSDGVLRDTPAPKNHQFSRLDYLRDKLVSNLTPTTVVKRWEYPMLYSGRKQAIYQNAVNSLYRRGISKRDAIVNTFVKAEKVILKPGGAVPRVIQPRSARYNVEVGRYLKLFEKELFRGFKRTFGYNVIVKGLNASQVGDQLAQHWSKFGSPVAVGLDASRFDQHVSIDALKFEHSVYNGVFSSPELASLLEWQLINKGRAYLGDKKISYTTNGCRMSGDINTSMGNCLIMSLIVLGYIRSKGLNARLANNGDDCVVFLEKGDLHLMDDIDQWFLDFGFKLTREAPVYELEHVEFCQTHPVWTESGWRQVRNPHSAPSKDMVSLQTWSKPADVANWRAAIGRCGFELTQGVPFWESFYTKVGIDGGNLNVDGLVRESGMGFMARGVQGCDISDRARYSFWKAFGMTPDMQLELESEPWTILDEVPIHMTFGDVINDRHNSLSLWSDATRV